MSQTDIPTDRVERNCGDSDSESGREWDRERESVERAQYDALVDATIFSLLILLTLHRIVSHRIALYRFDSYCYSLLMLSLVRPR